MTRHRLFRLAYLGTALAFAAAAPAILAPVSAQADEKKTVRPEVGKPIQAAQKLQKEHRFSEALQELRKADAVPNKTPYETYVLEITRGSIAEQGGDHPAAMRAFEEVLNSGMASPDLELKISEAIAQNHYAQKDYAAAVTWANRYFKAGGTDPQMHVLVLQAYYLAKNYPEAERMAQQQIAASERAGQKPSEQTIQLWASSANSAGDKAGYTAALEKLVTYYPTIPYWLDLIHGAQTKPGFSDRLSLDAERLQFQVGALGSTPAEQTSALTDMVQLAVEGGQPSEAQSLIAYAYQKGLFGSGPDAARQARLKATVDKAVAQERRDLDKGAAEAQRAPSGDALVNIGFSFVHSGDVQRGVQLMQDGVAKGGLKHPGEAMLHLGIAQLKAGQKAQAIQTFSQIRDADGSADLAQLWKIAATQTR